MHLISFCTDPDSIEYRFNSGGINTVGAELWILYLGPEAKPAEDQWSLKHGRIPCIDRHERLPLLLFHTHTHASSMGLIHVPVCRVPVDDDCSLMLCLDRHKARRVSTASLHSRDLACQTLSASRPSCSSLICYPCVSPSLIHQGL